MGKIINDAKMATNNTLTTCHSCCRLSVFVCHYICPSLRLSMTIFFSFYRRFVKSIQTIELVDGRRETNCVTRKYDNCDSGAILSASAVFVVVVAIVVTVELRFITSFVRLSLGRRQKTVQEERRRERFPLKRGKSIKFIAKQSAAQSEVFGTPY